jgi:hypothetical protein
MLIDPQFVPKKNVGIEKSVFSTTMLTRIAYKIFRK